MYHVFFLDNEKHLRKKSVNSLQNIQFETWNFVIAVYKDGDLMPTSSLSGLIPEEIYFYGKVDLFSNEFLFNNIVLQPNKRTLQGSLVFNTDLNLFHNEYLGQNAATKNINYVEVSTGHYVSLNKVNYKGLAFVWCEAQRLAVPFGGLTHLSVYFFDYLGELKTVEHITNTPIFVPYGTTQVKYSPLSSDGSINNPIDFAINPQSVVDLSPLYDPNIVRSVQNWLSDDTQKSFVHTFNNTYIIIDVFATSYDPTALNSGRILTRFAF